MKLNNFKISSKKLHLIIILLITSLVYANILQNGFIGDDHGFIVEWNEIKSFKNIPSLLAGAVPFNHGGVYRPLRGVIYTISYKLWGLNPAGYHFQSILVHLACTILVYFVVLQITKKNIIAFMSGLLFGVHPIHTGAIAFITSSFDQIGIIFFLASLYFYLKFSEKKTGKKELVISIIFATLAFFTYELALTLPLVIILHDLCFNKEIHEKISKIRARLKIYSPYFLSALVYAIIRQLVVKVGSRGMYLAGSFYYTMLAMSKIILKELQLIIFPTNMNVHHVVSKGILAFGNAAANEKAILSQSIFDLSILVSILLIVSLLVIIKISYKKQPLVSFCVAWFFITLSPVLNIIPIQTLLDEDFLYMPSLAFCLLLPFGIYYFYDKFSKKGGMKYIKLGLIAFFIILTIFYSSLTVSRNSDWRDELSLWSKTVKQTPDSAVVRTHLANAYTSQGDIELAMEQYSAALFINPDYATAHYALGYLYQGQGKLDLAVEEYKKTVEINPNYAKAYNNLGTIYKSQGNFELAIDEYKKAIAVYPKYAKAHYNLGNVYFLSGLIELAIDEYQKALAINPTYTKASNNLNKALENKKK